MFRPIFGLMILLTVFAILPVYAEGPVLPSPVLELQGTPAPTMQLPNEVETGEPGVENASPGGPAAGIVATITVGSSPRGIAANPNTNRIYVAYGSSTVSVIDGATQSVIKNITVGSNPFYQIGINLSTNRVYVPNNGSSSLSVIDGNTNAVIKTISGLGSTPEGVDVHPGRNRVYVTHGGSSLSVIDGATNTISSVTATGTWNHQVAVNPNTDRAYVSRSDPNLVAVINLATNQKTTDINAVGHPAIDTITNRVYLAHYSSALVTVIDGATNSVITTIAKQGSGGLVAVNSLTHCIYATNPSRNTVSIIDGVTNQAVGTVVVGINPMGITVNSVTGLVYVANNGSGNVSVIRDDVCNESREYTIAGRVTRTDGNPLSGVAISDGAGHSVLTDASGNYTLGGVVAGTYTLTPSKSDWTTFSPASRTVTVPPDATGQDFTATAEKHPLILLPGMMASWNWSCFSVGIGCGDRAQWGWTPVQAAAVYRPLIAEFNAAGYTEANGYLKVIFYDWRRPIGEHAALVNDTVHALLAQTGASEVDIVGHSMGGLVGRAYVQSNLYDGKVSHLITIGSPHRGAAQAYPTWEGAMIYGSGWLGKADRVVYALMSWQLGKLNDLARLAFFRSIASSQNLLPIDNYLYDEGNNDQPKPVGSLQQQNNFLPGLDADLATLFARTDVSTFVGTGKSTTARFYVYDRPFFDYPLWDDGKPDWTREAEFGGDGDETVASASAALPAPAHVMTFSGVNHGALPGNSEVISNVFATLGIPLPVGAASQPTAAEEPVLILALDGSGELLVTDALGRQVGSGGSTIPGAQYFSAPGDSVKLVIIPAPEPGELAIGMHGALADTYRLGLLDTFGPPSTVITDVMELWDTAQGLAAASTPITFTTTYTAGMQAPPPLLAEVPMIELPLRAGSLTVLGRATPGAIVEVRDADSGAVLGSALVDAQGRFSVALLAPIGLRQRVYPWSQGMAGVTITAQPLTTYLPTVLRGP